MLIQYITPGYVNEGIITYFKVKSIYTSFTSRNNQAKKNEEVDINMLLEESNPTIKMLIQCYNAAKSKLLRSKS
ncbi:hypothetical protein RIR_jg4804.t2 [Rhizophagus irregularis DAOM 181602=DAOM 197198]|nr:hypothetical protein RIR_jg4804.t2 [Rhizophagus irregularis DAOM 181602=DAOM 197198]